MTDNKLTASTSSVVLVAKGLLEISGALGEIIQALPDGEARTRAAQRIERLDGQIGELLNSIEKDLQ